MTTTLSPSLSEEDYQKHLAQLEKEWKRPKPNESHMFLMLKETYKSNASWIKDLPDGQVAIILDKIPVYENAKYVSVYSFVIICLYVVIIKLI